LPGAPHSPDRSIIVRGHDEAGPPAFPLPRLRPAEDAVVIDSTAVDVDSVVERIMEEIKRKISLIH